MKAKISFRIRKLRESKDFSQENMANDLNITSSAYSKIERGITDPSIGRLAEIAKILEVDITYFFQDGEIGKWEEKNNPLYGFATKSELTALNDAIKQLKQELLLIRKELNASKKKK